jgi:acyl dehydratase
MGVVGETGSKVALTGGFSAEGIGAWSEPAEFEVTRERIMAYAAATNDDIPLHASGELAPPVFAVVPAFATMASSGSTVIPSELAPMIVHGEQDFVFHRPITPGMTLMTRAAPIGLQTRSSGVTVVVKVAVTDRADGSPVCDQHSTIFVRGGDAGGSVGEGAPSHSFPERAETPVVEVVQAFDADQTFRYSAASGDPMPIHLDDDFARAMGLPGIIIHGLCTMAFTSRAVIQNACPDDPTRLRRLAVRFSKPVLPGQEITTRIWAAGQRDGRAVYAFETTGPGGAPVIKDGLAEVAA